MKLGFVSAILAEQPLDHVLDFARNEGFTCVELMCWPPGKAERRYAGVSHIDVTSLDDEAAARIRDEVQGRGLTISGLGYYPNPLSPDPAEAEIAVTHLRAVIAAAPRLGVHLVNTFVGRDPSRSVEANWPRFLETWKPLVRHAEAHGVRIAIENCPMYFTEDEWPGGKNLATAPAIWRRMFNDIPSDSFGLNYDPSHLLWQRMDYLKPIREFAPKLFHVHAKDAVVDQDALDDAGLLATPLSYHTPKLPGLGQIDWGAFCSALTRTGYSGPVCIEVEDRPYEATLETRHAALRQSARFLRNYLSEGG